MKKSFFVSTAMIMSAVIFPMANLSAATLINENVTGNVNASVNSTTNGSNGTHSNITIKSNSTVNEGVSGRSTIKNNTKNGTSNNSVDEGMNGSMSASSYNDSRSDNGSHYNLSSDSSSEVNFGEGSSIKLGREDISTDENSNESATSATVVTSDRVHTQEDLKAFAASSLRGDTNLEGMTFSDSAVDVAYRARGRFLAIIPVNLTAVAHVDANGEVLVKYPWYHFLVMSDEKVDFETSIKSEIQAMIKANGNGRLTAAQEAAIAARIHAMFRDNYNAIANANANANATSNSAINNQ